jgi:NADPH:quinone reductase
MRAVVTNAPGGLEHTALTEFDEPIPGDGDVVVELRAAGLNPADRFLIDGSYPGGPKPPFITGRDAAGVVVKSDAAGRFAVGTEVLVLQSSVTDLACGTLCDRQRFRADVLAPVPAGWSWPEAAAGPLVLQTAWKALTQHGAITSEHVVVVTGAGGGVGIAAVQLARGLGATVVALSRSPDKHGPLRELGARHVFSPDSPGVKKQVFEAIARNGADVVVDTVGGPLLTLAFHLLGLHGRVSALGVLGGVEGTVPIPALMFKQASLHGILVSGGTPQESAAEWRKIVAVMSKLGQRPIVDRCFALEDYEAAFQRLANNPFGKVVIVMNAA